MVSVQVRIYTEDGYKAPEPTVLSKEEYIRAMESLPILGADALILNDAGTHAYLTLRKAKPAQGLHWFVGGRIMTGETPDGGMARKFKDETGLTIDPKRFTLVAVHNYYFNERQQEPQNKGAHTVNYSYLVRLADDELKAIELEQNEYASKDALSCHALSEIAVENGFHPAVADIALTAARRQVEN